MVDRLGKLFLSNVFAVPLNKWLHQVYLIASAAYSCASSSSKRNTFYLNVYVPNRATFHATGRKLVFVRIIDSVCIFQPFVGVLNSKYGNHSLRDRFLATDGNKLNAGERVRPGDHYPDRSCKFIFGG